MNHSANNPLAAALADGLSFPIYAKVVGANGGAAEMLFESAEISHTISLHLPIHFPCKWTLTDSNDAISTFTQTATDVEELFERAQKRLN